MGRFSWVLPADTVAGHRRNAATANMTATARNPLSDPMTDMPNFALVATGSLSAMWSLRRIACSFRDGNPYVPPSRPYPSAHPWQPSMRKIAIRPERISTGCPPMMPPLMSGRGISERGHAKASFRGRGCRNPPGWFVLEVCTQRPPTERHTQVKFMLEPDKALRRTTRRRKRAYGPVSSPGAMDGKDRLHP